MCKNILLKSITLILLISINITSCFSDREIDTNDIEDYGKYYLDPIFPAIIPKNAEVINFGYYNFWDEVYDLFLELSFTNEAELLAYLDEIKNQAMDAHKGMMFRDGCFFEVQNPFNESYVDLIYAHLVSRADKYYAGFTVEIGDDGNTDCNIALIVISYSLSELRVIHSSTSGHSLHTEGVVHVYTPKYFDRFNISMYENSKMMYYFKKQDGALVYLESIFENIP